MRGRRAEPEKGKQMRGTLEQKKEKNDGGRINLSKEGGKYRGRKKLRGEDEH